MYLTKEGFQRALRTFIQAALAYIAVNLTLVDFSSEDEAVKSALTGLAVSALAAGLSAVMNLKVKETDDSE